MLRWCAVMLITILLVACGPEPTPIPPSEFATEEPVPQTPTPQPTPPNFDYTSFQHRTGVFTLLVPRDWQVIDQSTARLIDVEFVPPPGFGSRIYINVTNQADASEDDLLALVERTLQAGYTNDDTYEQVSRSEFVEGKLEVDYIYQDQFGARGRETVLFEQRGDYFIVLRTFLAERDAFALVTALETVRTTLEVDTAVVWGNPIAATNPDELFLVNTLAWQSDGLTYYTGEVYNTSPSDIDDVMLRVAFCNASNAVLVEVEQPLEYGVVPQGGSVPFSIVTDGIGRTAGLNVCVEQISSKPAQPPDNYITGLALETTASASFDRLIVRGDLSNQTLSPVTEIDVLLAAYNAEDQIIGQEIISLDGLTLQPGETVPFTHTLQELGGTPNRYTQLTQARTISSEEASLRDLESVE